MPSGIPGSPAVRVIVLAYAAVVAVALLQPSANIASQTVLHVADLLDDLGAPASITTPRRVENLLNGAMFVPPAVVAMLAVPRLRWLEVVGLGFCGSLAVEVVQGAILPARNAEWVDVVTNSAGALLGAVLGALLRIAARRRDHS